MKVRVPKQSKEERRSANSNNFFIELEKPMVQIDEKIKSQYEKMVKEYGELRKLDIIEYMKTSEFISLFSPCTPPIRKRISESVSRLGEEVILKDLENYINDIQSKYNLTLETIVEKMKSGKFSLKLKRLVPQSLASIAERAGNKFIEQKSEELKRQRVGEEDISLSSEDKPLEEGIQVKKVSNDFTVKSVDKKSKEATGMTIEEEQFFEEVKKFTNGFKFLSKDSLEYISETGKRALNKFDNLDNYMKFTRLQEIVRKTMFSLKADEASAINSILTKSNGRLNSVDFNVLKARKQELNRKRNIKRLQDEQEM